MSPETIFNIANMIALIGWIVLLIIPFWENADRFVVGIIVALLGVLYAWLIVTEFKISDASGFSSLTGIRKIFDNPKLLLAGWVHYLAFDLLAGLFIRKNALKLGVSNWIVIPCMIFTFLLGPIGLLLYLLARWFNTRRYFSENY